MWCLLVVMKRSLFNMKKTARVADENMVDVVREEEFPIFVHRRRRSHGWNNNGLISILYSIVRAPFSLISCISHPTVNGADGVWVSGDFNARISEMNHLMVNDSMRYAILM
ncbi:uncharacterized protein LOC122093031 [Macadamia integrifolia]|uniref:uncharacterized protein LOC122093031 n=1 Tax=Macadamia integrifolia TaxID=60698 RepID=UPI001C52F4D3|nr:uncharacterized protein LOC122093031 [Macadamia integrifolia]